jgi:hypothetical protein
VLFRQIISRRAAAWVSPRAYIRLAKDKEQKNMKISYVNRRTVWTGLIGAAALAVLTAQLTPGTRLNASDHIDSPTLASDKGSDINDMYLFLDPNDNSRVVLVMTINPFLISSEIIGQAIFDHNIRYRFEIENTGDARTDRFIDVHFDRYVGREVRPGQMATITLPTGRSSARSCPSPTQGADVPDITPPPLKVTTDTASGVSFYAGTNDDPFFLDNTAANRYVLSSIRNPGNPDRAIFGTAPASTPPTVPVPTRIVRGRLPFRAGPRGQDPGPAARHLLGLQYPDHRAQRSGLAAARDGQRDRPERGHAAAARPARAHRRPGRRQRPLGDGGPRRPSARQQRLDPAGAQGRVQRRHARGRRAGPVPGRHHPVAAQLRTNDAHINRLLAMIQENGDILRLDLTVPNRGPGGGNNPEGGAPNPRNNFALGGRRLQDDVADATFTLINNGQPLGDFSDRNDLAFGNVFPFVAPQVMPNPNGVNDPDTRIRL